MSDPTSGSLVTTPPPEQPSVLGSTAPVDAGLPAGKQDKPPPPAKPEPKPSKRSTATDGTALGKGTVPQKKAATNGRPATANGRKPAAGKRPTNGKGAPAEEPAPKQPQNRSRSKRARKAR